MSDWEPKIVAFLCNWCSYGAADLAGVGRMEYPSNIRVVRIPCTGRMDPKFFMAALREGAADGVDDHAPDDGQEGAKGELGLDTQVHIDDLQAIRIEAVWKASGLPHQVPAIEEANQ